MPSKFPTLRIRCVFVKYKVYGGFLYGPQGEDCLHRSLNAAAITPSMDELARPS